MPRQPGPPPSRRDVLRAALALLAAPAAALAAAPVRPPRTDRAAADPLAALEARLGGRLGVAAVDTATGRSLRHRADERFPLCSTFKWLLAAQVLARVDAGAESLDRVVRFGPDDLLEYAPVTREHVAAGGLSVAALAAAAVEWSDNTAANLLLDTVGGPAGFTRFLRGLGDPATRLDRREPTLNTALPDDPRDTTRPAAMVADLEAVLLGDVLTAASRDRLTGWMVACATGAAKLRAGLPAGWRVGDKTGMGAHGSANDVAIAWPPGRAPLLVAAYLTGSDAPAAARNEVLAAVGGVVAAALGGAPAP